MIAADLAVTNAQTTVDADANTVGIEFDAATAAGVRDYLAANGLVGPIIEVTGAKRMVFLATGANNAELAMAWMSATGATIRSASSLPVPAPLNCDNGFRWAVAPQEAAMPAVVVISAALRASIRVGAAHAA